MTPAQFRADSNLQQMWAHELRESMLLKTVIQVLEDWHPAKMAINLDNDGDISPTKAAFELGTHKGYSRCIETLKQLGVATRIATPLPEPDYAEPKYEVTKEDIY
jgi:hypothetical protein